MFPDLGSSGMGVLAGGRVGLVGLVGGMGVFVGGTIVAAHVGPNSPSALLQIT